MPPAEEASRIQAWLCKGCSQTGIEPWEWLRGFVNRTNRVLQLV